MILFWILTNDADFFVSWGCLHIVSCIVYSKLNYSLLISIMATRRRAHAFHWALWAFCRELMPFIQQCLSQITLTLGRLSILLTASSIVSKMCCMGFWSGEFVGWSILVMSCCWRKTVTDLILLSNRIEVDECHARRSLWKPYWQRLPDIMSGVDTGMMASDSTTLVTW